ncbi:hypothetical protein GCM10011495_30650 [Hymenobacter frigidus]|uniref:Fibronectin type-III domain-containing protein n=1 Tax=Hymenobacter frigidus TaxID=1524095 RepID=A0ABQ2ADF1_9BACT|nr:hypothetical protein GCM10011495_30650 [Hymenobacter frigidus]
MYTAGPGSGAGGDTYSFGATGSIERAFGGLQSGTLTPTIGAAYTNNTGTVITSMTITYTGEQWRLGATGRVDRLDFQYSTTATTLGAATGYVDVNGLDFTAPISTGTAGSLDGNVAANRTVGITGTITGLALANGGTIYIRWSDFNPTGADDGLAIDDYSVSFTTQAPAAPTLAVSQAGTGYANNGTAFDFGTQTVTTSSAPVAFTLTNSGPDPLTISTIAATGDYAVSGATPGTVAAGGTATVSVVFTPTVAGTRAGTLVITSNATTGTTYTVNLTGTGIGATPNPEINVQQAGTTFLTGSTYSAFANTAVGASGAALTFTIQNTSSTDALNISSVATTGDFAVSGLTTPATVPANGSVTVNVVFSPTATGTRSGTLVINNNDQDEAIYTINLQGEGVNPVPVISTLAPASATAGAPGFTLTVNGSGFVSGAVVSFNGTNRVTTFVSAAQLTAAVLAADVATAGPYNVIVTNPAPGGGASAAAVFTVNPPPVPTLTSINPSSIVAGQATTVTFTGTGFVSGATVSFNGNTLATTFVNSTTLTASITPPAQSATATYPVSVTTPGGTSGPQTLTATGVFVLTPVSIAAVNTPATQDFNSLAATGTAPKTTLPPGIDFSEAGGDANYTAGTGSATSGDTYSFGATSNTERALGTLLSGSITSTIGAQYSNNTGQTITSLAISYTGEQWRLGTTGRVDQLDFQYSTASGVTLSTGIYSDVNALDFVAPVTSGTVGALNGNVVPNRTAVSGTITGLSIPVGATFFIRWNDLNATGADDGLAVDDLSLTANPAVACNAPTALAASGVTSNAAMVSFTGSASAVNGYTVTTVPVTTTQTLGAAATSVSFTGLTPGTAYTVNIVSNCAAGATSSAASIGFITLAAAPALTVTQGTTPIANGANPSYSFGNQTTGTKQSATFTLTNNGLDPLTISGISATNPATFTFNTLPLPATVAANGGTVLLTVIYNVGTGPETGTIGITSDAANGNASFQLNLSGTGVPVAANPLIAVTQAGTAIPNGGTYSGFSSPVSTASSSVTFTISNPSTTDALSLGTFVLTGPFFLSGTQPATVAPGGTADFGLTFLPSAVGTSTGSISIPNNSQANNPYIINLSGQGTPADLVVGTAQNVSGTYNNVTVTSAGIATLTGVLTVNGTLTVAGVLSGNCQSVTTNVKAVNGPGSFILQAGGRLDICDAAGITASGATGLIQVAGTRSYSPDATYAYLGGLAQVTGSGLPSQVRAVVVNNANGLTLSQAAAVAQTLTLTAGNLTTAGNSLTLLSSAAGTAVVVNTGGVVVGTATVQRYISSTNAIGYRHYSAPVSNTTVNDLNTTGFTPTFNPTYNTSATPSLVTPFPTVFGYDQNRVGTVTSTCGPFNKGWFSPAAGDAMAVNRGYTVNAPNSALVDFVGTLNNGTQNSGALAYSGTDGGWQFLGNPYPAPLNWNTVTPAQRPGMDAAMYVFQSSGQYGGSYRTFANGIGESSLVPTAAGYFVRVAAVGANGSVNLTNANRVITFDPEPIFGRGTADARPQLQLQLRGTAAGRDETYVYFEAGATAGRDVEYDATKLANPSGLNVASLAASQEMAINGLPVLGNSVVLVPLAVTVPQAGTYTLEAANVANFTGTVTLIDALTSTRTVLTTGSTYAFTLGATTAPGRFTLEFRAAGVLASSAAQALAAQVQLFPNPTSGLFRVQLPLLSSKSAVAATLSNSLGQTVQTRTLRAPAGQGIDAMFDVRDLAAGVYTLRLNVDGTPVVRKVVVE